MDNLFVFTLTKKSHIAKLEDLLKALKISPKKCKHFRKELQYMRNTILLKIGESV